MPAKSKLREIEQREGKPIAVVLRDAYAKHGSQKEVARALGISAPRLSEWIAQLGLREWRILVPKQERGA